MRLLCIRHGDEPEDDRVSGWCRKTGIAADVRRPFKGEDAGAIAEDVAGIVIYGGLYTATETRRHPFLRDEYDLIEAAMASATPLLGICQGAQMIAHALGAHVGPPDHGSHEFGYYEVSPTPAGRDLLPRPLHVCQAHYHGYDLPRGAAHLARSRLFEQQAFRYGASTYGFQFHAEQTIDGFRRWQASSSSYGQPGAQTRAEQEVLMHRHDPAQAAWFNGFLDRFLAHAAPPAAGETTRVAATPGRGSAAWLRARSTERP